ncbi:hypothetical protein ANTQUA_LOCUS9691 [Anthophora quadrimaculata]
MGNQVTRAGHASNKKADTVPHTADTTNANSLSKSSSGTELESNSHMQFFPIESLAKTLSHLTHDEERINGITKSVFQRYLFPNYPELGENLFNYLHHAANVNSSHMSANSFKQQAEKFISIMNDQSILENYVKMYSNIKEDGSVSPDGLKDLLNLSYKIAMDSSGTPSCLYAEQIINAVAISCFHGKYALSVSYVSNWLWQNCPHIVYSPHRYVIHVLTTAYRNGKALLSKEQPQPHLEIPTPILEQPESLDFPQILLPVSYVWLLSTTLPQCYLQADDSPKDITHALIAKRMGNVTEVPLYCSYELLVQTKIQIIEKGGKLLYLNTNIRGYPHGLRFGISIAGAPYPIASLEMWGCGDTKLRERQLEIKKWQVKEAEKQRIVKLSASDWIDHPDRYLLELAGFISFMLPDEYGMCYEWKIHKSNILISRIKRSFETLK